MDTLLKTPSTSTSEEEDAVQWRSLGSSIWEEPSLVNHAATSLRIQIHEQLNICIQQAPRLAARCDDTATNHDTASLTTTERESATGATVWDAAVALARYVHAHRQLVTNCRVVELGAGCGLVGIAAAHCGASHVVLTDREELQPLLRTNACGDLPTAVDVHVFDWSDEKDLAPRADVVLASEVAYDEEVVPQLVNAASRCLQGRGVLLASFDGAVGRHSANRALLTTLADRGWNVRVEPGGAWLHRDTISVVLATPPPQSS